MAESDLTLDSIRVAIDCGLVERPVPVGTRWFSRVVPISRTTADARAAAAGQCDTGICYRLYTTYDAMDATTPPPMQSRPLLSTLLALVCLGVDPVGLPWPAPPLQGAWQAARERAVATGALDSCGVITEVGKLAACTMGDDISVARLLSCRLQLCGANIGIALAALVAAPTPLVFGAVNSIEATGRHRAAVELLSAACRGQGDVVLAYRIVEDFCRGGLGVGNVDAPRALAVIEDEYARFVASGDMLRVFGGLRTGRGAALVERYSDAFAQALAWCQQRYVSLPAVVAALSRMRALQDTCGALAAPTRTHDGDGAAPIVQRYMLWAYADNVAVRAAATVSYELLATAPGAPPVHVPLDPASAVARTAPGPPPLLVFRDVDPVTGAARVCTPVEPAWLAEILPAAAARLSGRGT